MRAMEIEKSHLTRSIKNLVGGGEVVQDKGHLVESVNRNGRMYECT